jgi:hypothetical protein
MQNVVLSLLINGLMAALLITTMVYCLRLNKRIKLLQDSKSELARIIREFDESTQRATQSIADIHTATARLSENIQHKIDKANFLASDLEHMIERGNKMMGKPEMVQLQPASESKMPLTPRPISKSPAAAFLPDEQPAPKAGTGGAGRVRSRAEQEIMSALSAKNNGKE